jgi:hypothetical protein
MTSALPNPDPALPDYDSVKLGILHDVNYRLFDCMAKMEIFPSSKTNKQQKYFHRYD